MFLGYPLYSIYVYLRLQKDVLWSLQGIRYIPYIRGLKEDSPCSLGMPSCVSEVAEGCPVVPCMGICYCIQGLMEDVLYSFLGILCICVSTVTEAYSVISWGLGFRYIPCFRGLTEDVLLVPWVSPVYLCI